MAFGAVSYAIARREKKLKIGGGAARSYFLLVDTGESACSKASASCRSGSEEGDEVILKDRQFALRLGSRCASIWSRCPAMRRSSPAISTEITEQFHSLPPLAVAFEHDEEQGNARSHRAIGGDPDRNRHAENSVRVRCRQHASAGMWNSRSEKKAWPVCKPIGALPAQFNAAVEKYRRVFGSKSKQVDPKAVKNLRADLEKLLGSPRNEWQTPLLRAHVHGACWKDRNTAVVPITMNGSGSA